jgi:hypothetical protein
MLFVCSAYCDWPVNRREKIDVPVCDFLDKRRPDIAHFVTSMGDNLKTINDSTASKMKAL